MVAVVARTFLKGSSRLRRAVPLINRCTSLLLVLMTTVSVARLIPITDPKIDTRRYPALLSRLSDVSHHEAGVNASVPAADDGYLRILGGHPVFYPAPSQHGVVFCFPQKVGSTRWKNLLYRGRADERTARAHGYAHGMSSNIHKIRAPWTFESRYDSREKLVAEMLDPSSLRFMFVRDPYVRMLSAFLDKICSRDSWKIKADEWNEYSKWLGNGVHFSCTPEEFYRYIKALLNLTDAGVDLDSHIALQSDLCGKQHGMEYDFYLKVEEEDLWYPELVALTGLEHAARSGWSVQVHIESHERVKLDVPDCFLKLPGSTCMETDAHIRDVVAGRDGFGTHRRAQQEGDAQWMMGKSTEHASGTLSQMHKYYSTWEIVDLATAFVRPDLITFKYPVMKFGESGEA